MSSENDSVDNRVSPVNDFYLRIFQAGLAVVTVIIGVVTFNIQQRSNIHLQFDLQAKIDSSNFQREVWIRQSAFCAQIIESAASIPICVDDSSMFSNNLKSFETLYYSSGIYISDTITLKSLKLFYNEVLDYQNQFSTVNRMKVRTDDLARACRDYLMTQ